jgi:hypothetical protein
LKKKLHGAVPLSVCAIMSLAALCGCAGQPSSPLGSHPSDVNISLPEFSGPWAADFTYALRKASSDFERKALSDGTISDAEFAEVEDRFISCLKAGGITSAGFNPDGSLEFGFPPSMGPDKANKISDGCSASSGRDTVGFLYFAMRRNSQNLDEAKIAAACLEKKGVVPRGYDASDYKRDVPDMAFPFSDQDEGQKALEACSDDPLGLLAKAK